MTVFTQPLTDEERQEIIDDLADTREMRSRCRGELHRQRQAGTATDSSVWKLERVINACSIWIERYEKVLAA